MRMGALLTLETAKIESSEWKTNGFQMFLYPLRFSKCEEVQGQELHKTPPELIIFGLRADLAFCTDGIFLHQDYSFLYVLELLFSFFSLVGVFSTFSGVSLEYTKVVVLKAIGHVKKTMHFPGDCLGN